MKIFFLVFARGEDHIYQKITELTALKTPFLIVCGKKISHPNVVYRKARGKYDAINFGAQFIPENVDIVVLNDVDTKIHNFQAAIKFFYNKQVALVFCKVSVKEGPQRHFYVILDAIRRRLPITCSGELMLIKHNVLKKILPIRPCKAEDSYILFKTFEFGHKAVFCEDCYTETERTKTAESEEEYKKINVTGIYQALSFTKKLVLIKIFYFLLPAISPLLLLTGNNGYYWMRGILLGLLGFIRGDREGYWDNSYMK